MPFLLGEPTYRGDSFISSFLPSFLQTSSFSSSLMTIAFENFKDFGYPLNTLETNLLLLLGTRTLLNTVWVLFKVKQLFKNTTQRSSPRLESYEWQGVWDTMGKDRGQWAPPLLWEFILEQVQNPGKLVIYLERACCHPGSSRETNHCNLLGPGPRRNGHKNHHSYWRRLEARPSQEQEEEVEQEVTSGSLSLSQLRDDPKGFQHHPGEHIITWLLQCWDNGASSSELVGSQAAEITCSGRENWQGDWQRDSTLSLWRWLLSAMKARLQGRCYMLSSQVECKRQSGLLDCVNQMDWHISPTGV